MTSALENLCGPNKPLVAEPADVDDRLVADLIAACEMVASRIEVWNE